MLKRTIISISLFFSIGCSSNDDADFEFDTDDLIEEFERWDAIEPGPACLEYGNTFVRRQVECDYLDGFYADDEEGHALTFAKNCDDPNATRKITPSSECIEAIKNASCKDFGLKGFDQTDSEYLCFADNYELNKTKD